GNIVNENRNPDGVVDRLEVLIESFLRGLVVIRRDHEHRIGARLLRMPRKLDRLGSGIRTGTGDHGNPSLRLLDAPADDTVVLLMRQGGALAGSPDGNQPVGALGNLPIHQSTEGLLVERAVAERGDERGKRASKARPGGHDTVL